MVLIVHQCHQCRQCHQCHPCHLSMLWYQIDGLIPGLLNNIGGAMLLCIFYCVPWLRRAAPPLRPRPSPQWRDRPPMSLQVTDFDLNDAESHCKSWNCLRLYIYFLLVVKIAASTSVVVKFQLVCSCLALALPAFCLFVYGMYNLLLQVATRSLQLHFHIGPIITVGGLQYITSADFWTLLDPPTTLQIHKAEWQWNDSGMTVEWQRNDSQMTEKYQWNDSRIM